MLAATASETVDEVVWQPTPGSQTWLLNCPCFEVLHSGTRGLGKTDCLIMDFAQHVGQGYGKAWRGILFREESTQLEEVRAKCDRFFNRIFPDARYVGGSQDKWKFPDGEQLLFRHMRTPRDYWKYHGHEYPWIGWEELTNWATSDCYQVMKSCCRSPFPGIPKKYRATANPYGPGHNWVKAYFIDPAPAGVPVANDDGLMRVRISGHYSENTHLLDADPDYPKRIAAAARNPAEAAAWLREDWDIVSGGMFDDVWDRSVHILEPFPIPASWRVDHAFDWGSSRPFSVGWWAESDGTEAPNGRIYPRRTLFRINEWYGWTGEPNVGLRMQDTEIAKGILAREKALDIAGSVKPGPADTNIYDADPGRETIADVMAKYGVRFNRAEKKPGSRKQGWEAVRRRLGAAKAGDKEEPGLYVFEGCRQFIRTVPTMPRSDRDPDDVNTDVEDHIADETRYRVLAPRHEFKSQPFRLV